MLHFGIELKGKFELVNNPYNMELTEKINSAILKSDEKLNKLHGWESNSIRSYIDQLSLGSVEVGYRSQCGSTHLTQKIYKEFIKVINMIEKSGIKINKQFVKHKNAYATINQGFWNSTIFSLTGQELNTSGL